MLLPIIGIGLGLAMYSKHKAAQQLAAVPDKRFEDGTTAPTTPESLMATNFGVASKPAPVLADKGTPETAAPSISDANPSTAFLQYATVAPSYFQPAPAPVAVSEGRDVSPVYTRTSLKPIP